MEGEEEEEAEEDTTKRETARSRLGDGIPRIDLPHVKRTLRNYMERLFMDQTDRVYEFLEKAIDGDSGDRNDGDRLVLLCRTDVAKRNAHVFSRLLRSAFAIKTEDEADEEKPSSPSVYGLIDGFELIIRDDDDDDHHDADNDDKNGELVEHERLVLPRIVK